MQKIKNNNKSKKVLKKSKVYGKIVLETREN